MSLLRSLLITATLAASLVLAGEAAAQQRDYSAQYDNWRQRVLGGPAAMDPYVHRLWDGGYDPTYWPGPTPVGNGYFYPPANFPYRFWNLPYRDVPAPQSQRPLYYY